MLKSKLFGKDLAENIDSVIIINGVMIGIVSAFFVYLRGFFLDIKNYLRHPTGPFEIRNP